MNFQKIPPVETPQGYLEIAFSQAKKGVAMFKQRLRRGDLLERQIKCEQQRLKEIAKSLQKSLGRLSTEFPNLDTLSEFYLQLMRATLDPERLRGSLASVDTATKNIQKLSAQLGRDYWNAESKEQLLERKRQALGRLTSFVNRLEKELRYLNKAREVMRTYPDVDPDRFTVAIAGFPNVGKSTLLNRMTGSKAETNEYAFTTKTLNSGSFEHRHNRIQCVDTPGTLARPERMNAIERQAYLAMKYAAHMIVYVYDLTEPYPLKEQERLEEEVRKYGKPILRYLSKTDILEKEKIDSFTREHYAVEALKLRIIEIFEKEFLGL